MSENIEKGDDSVLPVSGAGSDMKPEQKKVAAVWPFPTGRFDRQADPGLGMGILAQPTRPAPPMPPCKPARDADGAGDVGLGSLALSGWVISKDARGHWLITSPSGDGAHVFDDDGSALGNVMRQLLEAMNIGAPARVRQVSTAEHHMFWTDAPAAVVTLQRMGYTWNGGDMWKPLLGKAPDFDLLDAARHEADALRAENELLKSALAPVAKSGGAGLPHISVQISVGEWTVTRFLTKAMYEGDKDPRGRLLWLAQVCIENAMAAEKGGAQ